MGKSQHLFSVTISATRKQGMDEASYHEYISTKHASLMKELLVQNKIVDYTMQHNTPELMDGIDKLFPAAPHINRAPYDAFVTIVFRNVEDYLSVVNDPHYKEVVNPDHKNFADGPTTQMSYGWFEKHVAEGKVVEE